MSPLWVVRLFVAKVQPQPTLITVSLESSSALEFASFKFCALGAALSKTKLPEVIHCNAKVDLGNVFFGRLLIRGWFLTFILVCILVRVQLFLYVRSGINVSTRSEAVRCASDVEDGFLCPSAVSSDTDNAARLDNVAIHCAHEAVV